MINVPSNLSGAVNRQTVMNINNKKIQEPLSSRNIDSINTKFVNAASPNPNSTHTGSINTQSVNAAYTNTNSRSAGPVNTRSANTAPTNSGNHSFNSRPVPTIRIPAFKNPVRKGQKIPLKTQSRLTGIKAHLGWNITNPDCDVDVSAFLLNNTGKVIGDSWFVFYGQESSPDGSTVFFANQGQNREMISIDFVKLNPAVSKIVFVLTINEALEKHLNFSMIKDAYIQITDASNTELVSFKMDEYYSNVTSMMIGEIYQHNGIWKFNAIGNGVSRDLAGLCELYGVQVI